MSNRKSNHNSLESMIQEMEAGSTTVAMLDKLNIININSRAQTGGSKHNLQLSSDNSYNHVNKLLSMLATDSPTNTTATSVLEANLGNSLKMSGGRVSKLSTKNELTAFFKKYKINEVNGIKAKYFIQTHGASENSTVSEVSPVSEVSEVSDVSEVSPVSDELKVNTTTATNSAETTEATEATEATDASDPSNKVDKFSGGAGMNPGFQAFLNLKKKIAEELKISNGPKAAKIAGAVQKEMKAKYTNLNAVEIAAKGLEHFKKNHDKYKKMV